MLRIVAVSLLLIAILPFNASAYIDPGTGSMVLQVVAAAFLGAAFTIKSYWRTIKAYVANMFKRTDAQ